MIVFISIKFTLYFVQKLMLSISRDDGIQFSFYIAGF
jgi:hypothetical protein